MVKTFLSGKAANPKKDKHKVASYHLQQINSIHTTFFMAKAPALFRFLLDK